MYSPVSKIKSFGKRFKNGFESVFSGLGYIRTHRLWKYIILPALASLAVGSILILLAYFIISNVLLPAIAIATDKILSPFDLSPGTEISRYPDAYLITLELFALFLAFLITIMVYRMMASILVVPFAGPLLNAVERIELGYSVDVPLAKDIKNTLLGLWIAVRFTIVGIFFILIGFLLGPFQVPTNALVQSYIMGRGSFDLMFEKAARNMHDRRLLARKWRAEILGNGLGILLCLAIPFIGIFLAPISALVGAALLYYREADHKRAPRPIQVEPDIATGV